MKFLPVCGKCGSFKNASDCTAPARAMYTVYEHQCLAKVSGLLL